MLLHSGRVGGWVGGWVVVVGEVDGGEKRGGGEGWWWWWEKVKEGGGCVCGWRGEGLYTGTGPGAVGPRFMSCIQVSGQE